MNQTLFNTLMARLNVAITKAVAEGNTIDEVRLNMMKDSLTTTWYRSQNQAV